MVGSITEKSIVPAGIQGNTIKNKCLQLSTKHAIMKPKSRQKPERGVIMAGNNMVQFRIKAETRDKAEDICGKLGMDLSTYLRMCISRLVQEEGVPFEMTLKRKKKNSSISEMLQQFGEDAKRNGTSEMTLEEINAEIDAARREMA